MTPPKPHPESLDRKVFVIRLLRAAEGVAQGNQAPARNEQADWRGQIQDISSGQVVYFQGIAALYSILSEFLDPESAPELARRIKSQIGLH